MKVAFVEIKKSYDVQEKVRNLAASVLQYLNEDVVKDIMPIATKHYVLHDYRTFIHMLLVDAAMKYSFGYSSKNEYLEIRDFVVREDHKCWDNGEYTQWSDMFHCTFFPQYQLPFDKSLSAVKTAPKGTFTIISHGIQIINNKHVAFAVGFDDDRTICEVQFSSLL